ncbi:Oleuropein beta-glucosidase [Sesamum angolense]|uniref:Oleuropein beta-glucosidase n=1 Tax=Sesamum angolense TaxID=2727404 RepID=A0AAE1WEV7_9LAMI|nr:Oleuropein beta-glucosidase [Sesamum angolense]
MDSQNSLALISSNVDVPPVSDYQVARYNGAKLTRRDFDKDFIFGSATSAYQVEGAFAEGGKGPSNWDAFALRKPGKIADGSNGCVAIDQYHLYKDDIQTMKKVGLDAYRFSIAWSRVLPGGRLSAGINKEGLNYYSNLIDALLAEGIEPYVTLFHWDVPQCLEEEYGGFLSTLIVKDFLEFVELCFWEFGDRVKYWITLNEPWTFTNHGYIQAIFPPNHGSTVPEPIGIPILHHRCSGKSREIASKGDPGTEPYIVAHNLILAHAAAVDLYRKQFQVSQGGKIGVTNVSKWFEALNDHQDDNDAANRAVDFMLGWFVAPIVTGDYPPIMRQLVADRLPKFSPEEEKLIKGSYDFLGINYYTTNYATYTPNPVALNQVTMQISCLHSQGGSDWMYIVPNGIYKLLVHIKKTYRDPLIYITENGVDEINDKSKTVSEARIDDMRVKYHQDHLYYIKKAIDNDGVNVKAYFIWSLFDNYEWAEGYTVRFGIFYIDFENGRLTRYPKSSAIWWKNFLASPILLRARKRQVEETEDAVDVSVKRLRSGQGYN